MNKTQQKPLFPLHQVAFLYLTHYGTIQKP